MRFYLYFANHVGNVLQDLALHLQKSLESCGHRAHFSPRLVPGECNILVESFGPGVVQNAIELAGHGTPYIVWGTEEVTGDTFNRNVAAGHSHYGNEEHWQLRFDNFVTVAERAAAVWVPVESLVPAYQAVLPEVPVQFVPHGYAEGFPAVVQRPEAAKDIDFYFSGARTEHRSRLLDRLAKRHRVMHHDQTLPEYVRRDYLSRARVCLSLRLSEQTRLPSVSRMHNMVMNGCYTLHERCPLPSHLDPYVTHVPTEELFAACESALAWPGRAERALELRARLRDELPMSRVLPPILERALARR